MDKLLLKAALALSAPVVILAGLIFLAAGTLRHAQVICEVIGST